MALISPPLEWVDSSIHWPINCLSFEPIKYRDIIVTSYDHPKTQENHTRILVTKQESLHQLGQNGRKINDKTSIFWSW
jgi:hypothetical protein